MAVNLNPCNMTVRRRHVDRITGWDIICSEHGYIKTLRTKDKAISAARVHLGIEVTRSDDNGME